MTDPAGQTNWIEIATLIAASVAATAPIVKLWEVLRKERERFHLHIDWVDFGPNHPIDNAPFLFVANRTDKSIIVTEIHFLTGLWWRKRRAYTALEYEDPIDLNFPYEIEAHKMRRFWISNSQARRYFDQYPIKQKISSFIKRPLIWIEVQTSGGTAQRIGAEDIFPWQSRPSWRKLEELDA